MFLSLCQSAVRSRKISISDRSPEVDQIISSFVCVSAHRDVGEDERESLGIVPYVSVLNACFRLRGV